VVRLVRPRVFVRQSGDELHVYSPFEARDDVKSLPRRRWDAERKCWIVPFTHRRQVLDVLRQTCDVIDETNSIAWIAELFAVVPPRHRERVWRALAMACHPDVGGTNALMAAINREYEKLR
jgi:hypothetical protein